MMVFLTLHQGENPKTAEPIFATKDSRIILLVMNELSQILGGEVSKKQKERVKFDRRMKN